MTRRVPSLLRLTPYSPLLFAFFSSPAIDLLGGDGLPDVAIASQGEHKVIVVANPYTAYPLNGTVIVVCDDCLGVEMVGGCLMLGGGVMGDVRAMSTHGTLFPPHHHNVTLLWACR